MLAWLRRLLGATERQDGPSEPPITRAELERVVASALSRDAVTRKELEELFAEWKKRADWDLEEWYEKFSTLHARASKRLQRAAKEQGVPVAHLDQPEANGRPSVLSYRRPWSP